MLYIFDKTDTVGVPYSPEMLQWLNETYPYSKYRVVTLEES